MISLAAAFAFFGPTGDARGDTKDQCIAANEGAQALVHAGKLRAARTRLLSCVSKSCPEVLRRDCVESIDAVDHAIPTMVFRARINGVDTSAVAVTMDGEALADKLDGSPLPVDPGEHTFVLTTSGFPSASRVLVVREGERNRQELVSFGAPRAEATTPQAPESGTSDSGDSQRYIAYGVGGLGVVAVGLGVAFGLEAKSTYNDALSHCPAGPSSCDSDGVTGGEHAHTQATISTVSFIAGGALLAAGVALFLTAPRGEHDHGVKVEAAGSGHAAGLRVVGSF